MKQGDAFIRKFIGVALGDEKAFPVVLTTVGSRPPIRGPLPLLGLLVSLRRMFQVRVFRRGTDFPVSALCCSQFNGGARSSTPSY
jgi:hypothetical protein